MWPKMAKSFLVFTHLGVIEGFLSFPMKRLPQSLKAAFLRVMRERAVPVEQRQDYLKWLRFYLDFCLKRIYRPCCISRVAKAPNAARKPRIVNTMITTERVFAP